MNQDYNTTASFYENTQSSSARQAYETEMEQLKSDMNQMEQYREYTLIAAASAYAIGFLDALLFGGKRVPPDDIATTWSQDQKRFQMGLKPLYGGMGVSMSFQF